MVFFGNCVLAFVSCCVLAASTPTALPNPKPRPPAGKDNQTKAIAAIRKVSGKVVFAGGKAGNSVIEVYLFTGKDHLDRKELQSALSQLVAFPNLREVWLIGEQIEDIDLRHLSGLQSLDHITVLEGHITDHGLKHLTKLPQLRSLYLGWCNRITDKGMEHILKMRKLEHLDLAHTRVTNAALKRLPSLRHLRTLLLAETKISDDGLKHLQAFPSLETVELRAMPITDAGLPHLLGVRKLRSLTLESTLVTPGAIAAFQKKRPSVRIDQ
jgi:hypothetical protein